MKRLLILGAAALLLTGCAKYYRVTDNSSGDTYLTTSDTFKQEGSNRVATFRDRVTDANVTLNSYKFREMTEQEYKADLAARQSRLPVNPK